MDGWEPNEDPWFEHHSHSNNCLFVKLEKPEGDLQISNFLEINGNLMKNVINHLYDQEAKKVHTMGRKCFS